MRNTDKIADTKESFNKIREKVAINNLNQKISAHINWSDKQIALQKLQEKRREALLGIA
jgi:hypothetical protein